METHIAEQDIKALQELIAKVKGSSEEDVLSTMIERTVREHAMQLIRKDTEDLDQKIRQHLQFVIELCKEGVCNKNLAVVTMNDMMDVSRIDVCKKLFVIVEEMMPQFKQSPLVEASQTYVLRMCNDLLKRLSRTVETSFCGQVLSFLSRYLPLGEKSGLNLNGQFNTLNGTKFETDATEFTELLSSQDENMETGEIVETKESLIPVDSAFYQTFWRLQNFFSNPGLCYDAGKWPDFQKGLLEVASVLASHKLEKSNSDRGKKGEKNAQEMMEKADHYFAKYLTSPKLLQLQLNDSQFRRNYLVQVLIVTQYLTAEVKFKLPAMELNEEKTRFVLEIQDKCYKLLRETHPKGSSFVDHIKVILTREKEWSMWKNQGCYEMEKGLEKAPMLMYRKRPRQEFDPSIVDLGSPELTKLWSIEPDILKFCKEPKRKYVPSVEKFIEDPLDELDPEQQVEDEYKSINNSAFQWRASRFLMAEAEEFWTVKNDVKEYTSELAPFLEKVILRAGGKEETFSKKGEAPKETPKKDGSRSPGSDPKVSDEAVEELAFVLGKEHGLDELVQKLHPEFEKVEGEENDAAVKRLMVEFAEMKQRSVPQMANGILAAGLISEDVTKALNPALKNDLSSDKDSSSSSSEKASPSKQQQQQK